MDQLSNIKIGETVRIRQIEESPIRVKLLEMGLTIGKKLTLLYRAPMKDPIAIDVEGYVLSLRLEEAALILVER